MSAIGSVIVISYLFLSQDSFQVILTWTYQVVGLPRSLCDTWKFTTVRHFAEADAADSKFLIDSVRTTATLATCVTANLELWLTASFNFE